MSNAPSAVTFHSQGKWGVTAEGALLIADSVHTAPRSRSEPSNDRKCPVERQRGGARYLGHGPGGRPPFRSFGRRMAGSGDPRNRERRGIAPRLASPPPGGEPPRATARRYFRPARSFHAARAARARRQKPRA